MVKPFLLIALISLFGLLCTAFATLCRTTDIEQDGAVWCVFFALLIVGTLVVGAVFQWGWLYG